MLSVLLKKLDRCVNARTIGIAYLISGFFQMFWWSYFLFHNGERMTTMISDLFQAWLLGKLVATFICIVLLMSAWVTVQILLIAINVLRLSLDKNTRFYQSAKQRRDSYFAIGSIAVTFIVLVFMPALKAPQGSIAFMSAHVSIAILFGYNLMAITFYRGR